jgi:hypothetical protein
MSSRWSLLCLLSLGGALLSLPTSLRAQDAPRYGLRAMARFDALPELKDAVCRQVSSYDRSGGNGDAGHFLNGDTGRLPNDTALLADLKGPGCVYRLWSANAAGYIRFFFDGETQPRIACPMQDLFQDRYPPFRTPLAGHVSGGWYSYLPLPFARSLRIEVEHPGSMYYHVQYHQLPAGTPVRSFTRELTAEDSAALDQVLHDWTNLGRMPGGRPAGLVSHEGSRTLEGGRAATLLSERRAGTVRSLRVKVEPATRYSLRNLTLRAFWDGATAPAVEAPLGDFFGAAFGDQRFAAQPVAMTDTGYVCYFPMPFGKSARLEVLNEGREPVHLSWEVEVGPGPASADQGLYFHARWHRVTTEAGKHVTLLETTGRGHYVGVNVNMQGDRGIGFLEGDEKIYVDGESFPSIYGTGSEDFFTGGWYFDEGPFARAFHGCVVKDDVNSRISAYRYQITDCVPFKRSIRVDIEHGGMNDYPGADYAYTAYWYQDAPTDSWARLPALAERRPASIVVRDVMEAETLRLTDGRVMEDSELPVEVSRGRAVGPRDEGAPYSLELSLPAEAVYTLSVGVLEGPSGGRARFTLDGQPLGDTVDTYAPAPGVRRITLGTAGPLAAGPHALQVQPLGRNPRSEGRSVLIDYVGLRRQLYPGALEGERMRILAQTPGAALDPQDLQSFGNRWSSDAHLWFRPAEPGSFFTLELPAPAAGRYRLEVFLTKAVDYGRVQVSVDGQNVGPVFDGYNDGVVPSGRIALGEVELGAGPHALKFTVIGKNPRSTGYMVGVDAVRLVAVQ